MSYLGIFDRNEKCLLGHHWNFLNASVKHSHSIVLSRSGHLFLTKILTTLSSMSVLQKFHKMVHKVIHNSFQFVV